MKQKQDYEKILHAVGLKSTIPRLAVIQILSEIKYPHTAQEIHKKLIKSKIDLVTLYRTLTSFEKNQLIKRIDLHKDAVYYELNNVHHHHIVCTDCGKVEDFGFCNIDRLTKKIIAQAANFKNIYEHTFELFGVCNSCTQD
jgi:Fur family ferric uptake transcriptional regulator